MLISCSEVKENVTEQEITEQPAEVSEKWVESGIKWDPEADFKKGLREVGEDAKKLYYVGSTDKIPLTYEVDEPMVFTIASYIDGDMVDIPYYWYEVTSDGGKRQTGFAEAVDGRADITVSCSKPGFVRVQAYPCNENKKILKNTAIFEGGACAEFESVTVSATEPEDFDSFWAARLDELDAVKPEASVFEEMTEHTHPGFKVYDVRIPCVEGSRPVSGYLSIPENASADSLKIRVQFFGYGVSSASTGAQQGYITFRVNPHGIENGMEKSYYEALSASELSGFGFNGNEDPEESYFKNMILRDVQAVRYVMTEFEDLWNDTDIEIKGGSMGAFQSSAVAALMNDVVTSVHLDIPWMCDLGGVKHERLGGWRPSYCEGINYYDTVFFGKRIKAPVTIVAGLGDYICPPSGVAALFNGLTCEKNITFVQNKTHSYNPSVRVSYTSK